MYLRCPVLQWKIQYHDKKMVCHQIWKSHPIRVEVNDHWSNLATIPVGLGFLWDFLNSKPVHFIMKNYLYKSLMTWLPRFLNYFFQPLSSWRLSDAVSVSMVWRLRDSRVILLQSRHWTTSTMQQTSFLSTKSGPYKPGERGEHVLANHSLEEKTEGLWFLCIKSLVSK